jgi:hypothetical protein
MSVREIQQAVRRLPDAKRRRLTTWMVRAFPALAVEDLMAKGAARANSGTWVPTPPDADNIPTSATLRRAKGTAKRLGIAK